MPNSASFNDTYRQNIVRRRQLKISGYKTLAELGFDGDYVTPYQMTSCSETGPVLIAYHWLDAPSIEANRTILEKLGYLPGIQFNNVMDLALQFSNLTRSGIYMTQAFHLLPSLRSQRINSRDVDTSFEAVTKHELVGRRVIALGGDASRACDRHGIKHNAVCHPSARGRTNGDKAKEIANALKG